MVDEDGLEIRLGTVDDMDTVMNLSFLSTDENAFLPPDTGKIATEMWPALNMDHGIVGIIGKPGGEAEGAVLLRIGSMWYSASPVVEEKAVFVHPDYRTAKGGRARKLTDFSKKVADSLGIPLIIGILSNTRTEAKVRLYERQFGKPTGAFFLYGAKTGDYSRTEH